MAISVYILTAVGIVVALLKGATAGKTGTAGASAVVAPVFVRMMPSPLLVFISTWLLSP